MYWKEDTRSESARARNHVWVVGGKVRRGEVRRDSRRYLVSPIQQKKDEEPT